MGVLLFTLKTIDLILKIVEYLLLLQKRKSILRDVVSYALIGRFASLFKFYRS